MVRRQLQALLAATTFLAACSGRDPGSTTADDAGVDAQIVGDPVDVPIDGVTKQQLATFRAGDALFDLPLRDADGLGPLYTRTSCGACHDEAARGPGLVQKMAAVDTDGKTPAKDQSKLPFGHTIHPLVAGGGKTPIVAPTDPSVKVSIRVGPPVLGRGYMEAVSDAEILRLAAEQVTRTDGIKGRINHVVYQSEPNPDGKVHATKKGDTVIGRFGVKARIGFLDDFVADAAQGDMGITSPLRPQEIANPDGLLDDYKPGVDISVESINLRADYIRLIAIPRRPTAPDPAGAKLFQTTKCSVCHAPALETRHDYPFPQLAGIKVDVYTDFLLHDMGDQLADALPLGEDGEATYRDWRTAPLIGLRFMKNYLHDSRAHSVEEAILMHAGTGSEANGSVDLFQALSPADRASLLAFVEAL